MYRNAFLALAAVALAIVPKAVPAQTLEDRVIEHRLDNGMLFLLVPRPQAPVFTGALIVKVGGVDEPEGKSGMAHMFEHMAFKGTPWIGTSDYAGERRLLEHIDSVAVAYTRLRASIPQSDRAGLAALERRTTQSVDAAQPDLGERAALIALADALADTLSAVGDEQYPSLGEHVALKRLEARLKYLQAGHGADYAVKDEFSQIVRVNGGVDFNAGTSIDYTIYYESFPSHRLELWAMLESQRFMFPVMREFYSERDVIMEERRMRTEDDPNGKLYEMLTATALTAHPYRRPIVGWMSDIEQFTAAEALEFRSRYYVPSNAVGVLVGDIDVDAAKDALTRYFGRIPPATEPVPRVRTVEPEQRGERRIDVEFDAEPQIMIAYHKPNYPAPDSYVFSVIANILRDSGNSSRFYKSLVKSGVARSVSLYEEIPGQRYPNQFLIEAEPIAPHTTADIERIIYRELDSLATTPVPDRELQKCKNIIEGRFIRGLQDNATMARRLAHGQAVNGDWRLVATHRVIVSRVTPEDIMRVAGAWFTKENRTVGTLVRPVVQ